MALSVRRKLTVIGNDIYRRENFLRPLGHGHFLPGVVLCPKIPFMNEGNRILPPISEPTANGTPAAETIQPAPPELPPTVRVRSYGLFVVPYSVLRLEASQRPSDDFDALGDTYDSNHMQPSLTLVLHSRMAPDLSMFSTALAVSVQTKSFLETIPVALWKPGNCIDSLMANGTPRNGAFSSLHRSGRASLLSNNRSISRASVSAASNRSSTYTFRYGWMSRMRSMCARTTSYEVI